VSASSTEASAGLRLRDRRHLRDHGILLVGAISHGDSRFPRDDGVLLLGAIVGGRAWGAARTGGGGALAAIVAVLGELAWGVSPQFVHRRVLRLRAPFDRLNFRRHGDRGGESLLPKPAPPRAPLPREAMVLRSLCEAALQRAGFFVGEVAGGGGPGGSGGGE
jgi:hypothetical protein